MLLPDVGDAEAGSIIELKRMREVFFHEIMLSVLPYAGSEYVTWPCSRTPQWSRSARLGSTVHGCYLTPNWNALWTASSTARRRPSQSTSVGMFPCAIATPVQVHIQPQHLCQRCQNLQISNKPETHLI
jgi:hypothetical protein